MRVLILSALLFCSASNAGLPPTSTKGSGDSSNITTFNILMPNTPITHSGVTATLGTLTVPGGGTGVTTIGSSLIVLGNGVNPISTVTQGTSGQVLSLNSSLTPAWTASASAPTSAYSVAKFTNSSTWTTTSASFVDGTNSGGNALTVLYSSGITLTAAASSVCGITFTPSSSTAVYQVDVTAMADNSSGSGGTSMRLYDGTNELGQSGLQSGSGGAPGSTLTIPAIFAPASTSAQTLKLQLRAGANTARIDGLSTDYSVMWRVVKIVN